LRAGVIDLEQQDLLARLRCLPTLHRNATRVSRRNRPVPLRFVESPQ
jgi:hypothetical protein